MFELDPRFDARTVIVTLMGTLVLVNLVVAAVGFRLLRQLSRIRRLQGQYEQLNTAVTLLTEATESGFRWTTAELQRVTAIVRRNRSTQDVQHRLEQAVTLGKTARQIAGEEGLPEGEVQLRIHLADTPTAPTTRTETHIGAM